MARPAQWSHGPHSIFAGPWQARRCLAAAATVVGLAGCAGSAPSGGLADVSSSATAEVAAGEIDAAAPPADVPDGGSPQWGPDVPHTDPPGYPDVGPTKPPPDSGPDTFSPDTLIEENWPGPDGGPTSCNPWNCDDNNSCTVDQCVAGMGCVHSPAAAGTPCSDNTACTQGNSCQWGQCGSGALGPLAMGPGDQGHVLPLEDGGAVAVGSKTWPPNAGSAWCKRVDGSGTPSWEIDWKLGDGGGVAGSLAGPDGGYYVVGQAALTPLAPGQSTSVRPWAARISAAGQVVWEKEVTAVGLGETSTAVTRPNGDLWVLERGYSPAEPSQLIRLTAAGELLGASELGAPVAVGKGQSVWSTALAMAAEASGTVLVTGIGREVSGGKIYPSSTLVWRMAADGSVVSQHTFPLAKFGQFNALGADAGGWWAASEVATNGGIHPLVLRFGQDDQLQWRSQAALPGAVVSLWPLANGQVAVLGSTQGWGAARLLLVDADGGVLWDTKAALSNANAKHLYPRGTGWMWTDTDVQAGVAQVLWLRADSWGHDGCLAAGACGDLVPTNCAGNGPCAPATCAPSGGCAPTLPQCDDGLACTADSCNPSQGCVHYPIANGAPCDDGNPCTKGDLCTDGACDGPADKAPCSDGNPCTVDTCLGPDGCSHAQAADGTPCDDSIACTLGDTCSQGKCGYPSVWARLLLPQKTGTIVGLFALPDDGLAVVGSAGSAGAQVPTVVALDHGGNVLSEQTIASPLSSAELRATAQLADGSLVGVGSAANQLLIVRWPTLDGSGQVQTESMGGVTLGDAVTPCTGGYVVGGRLGGQAFLQKRTGQGKVVWTQMLNVLNAVRVDSLASDPQGNLAAAIAVPMDLPGTDWISATVVGVNSTGSALWQMPMWPMTLRLRVLRSQGKSWLAAGHSGTPDGYEAEAFIGQIDATGKLASSGMYAQSGHVTALAGSGSDWHAGVVHIGKQPSDWRGDVYVSTGTGWKWQVELLASGQGTNMALLRRNSGWDAAAAVGPGGYPDFAWQVVRTTDQGFTKCP